MTRVAIYARYSSDLQDGRSIADQVYLCRDYLRRQGWTETAVYADEARSGAHLRSRPQVLALLSDVSSGGVDVVLAEALDRLSRDQEDIAGLYKRIQFHGAKLVTVSEQEVSELHIGLKGTMNAMFLKDLAAKIRRGQMGRAVAGFIPGGRAYGYDVVRGELDARGEPIRGLRTINEAEAEIVRRIFIAYASGASARAIAHRLNKEGVPSPRGGAWGDSTISGNRKRMSGILWNPAYVGRPAFGRVRMVKDPDTGNRLSRVNASDDVLFVDQPGLRIIDDALWQTVQDRKARFDDRTGPQQRHQKHILSGLIKCGCCGGTYQIQYQGRMSCATRRTKGESECANTRTVLLDTVTERVLNGIRRSLKTPEAMAAMVKEYHAERKRLAASRASAAGRATARMKEVDAELSKIVAAIAAVGHSDLLIERLRALESERKGLQGAVAEAEVEDNVISIHPEVIADYQRAVEDLDRALRSDDMTVTEARSILLRVFDRIEVHPLPGRGAFDLRAMTRIEALIPDASGTGYVESRGSGGGT